MANMLGGRKKGSRNRGWLATWLPGAAFVVPRRGSRRSRSDCALRPPRIWGEEAAVPLSPVPPSILFIVAVRNFAAKDDRIGSLSQYRPRRSHLNSEPRK